MTAHSWRIASVGIALAALALVAACGDDDDEASTTTDRTETRESTTTTAPPVFPLTGLPVTGEDGAPWPALVIKVDNTPAAQAYHVGLAEADVVYNEKVEGGAVRLAAVFHSTEAPAVGPVRSARTTDVALVANLHRPLFAYSGANAGVLAQIRNADLVDLGYDSHPDLYRKRRGVPSVLRFQVGTADLWAQAPPDSRPPAPLFTYRAEDEEVDAAGATPVGGIALSYGGAVDTSVSYRYDPAVDGWVRTQHGRVHTDEAGTTIAPANVVVQFVAYRSSGFIDVTGAPSPEAVLVGQGEAWILTDGTLVRGRWERPDEASPTRWLDSAGRPIDLTPGRTWVELAHAGGGTASVQP